MRQSNRLANGVLIASVIAGVSYVAAWDRGLPEAAELTWKGLGVGLLAVHAALRARSLDGWLLTAVMAFGALGDVLLGAAGLAVGGVAFLIGHLIAIGLYRRHARRPATRGALGLALGLVVATVAIAFALPADRAAAPGVAVYSLGLVLMAAAALLSRLPRSVAIGALMFVASDLLIFARAGPLPDSLAVGLGVWGLYYFGQMLICLGGIKGLAAASPALAEKGGDGVRTP